MARTKADRDFDLQSGREIERKDAEIARLLTALEKIASDGKNCADHCRKQASRAIDQHAHTQTSTQNE